MKQIPAALLDCETRCFILRILTKTGVVFSTTSLDVDITFDPSLVDPYGTGDSWGSAVARADNGFSASRAESTADLNVDNMEVQGWVSNAGITEAQIRAGFFDYAQWRLYRVDYTDLSKGHELVNAGTTGETDFSAGGWKTEFRSLTQQLMQPMANLYSLTCPKTFGSMPIGTGGEQPESRHPCGKLWTWVEGEVTSVDVTEPDRIFTDSSLAFAADHFNPGVIEILDGENAGAQIEVETNTSGGKITLALPLAYVLANGVNYRIRQDCNKRDRERNGVSGDCKDKHDNLLQFGGQPDIPVADGGTLMVPGAHIRQ